MRESHLIRCSIPPSIFLKDCASLLVIHSVTGTEVLEEQKVDLGLLHLLSVLPHNRLTLTMQDPE